MSSRTAQQPSQPSQPPKESAYTQSSNPVTHSPYETRKSQEREQRSYGAAPGLITRGASSKPSTNATILAAKQRHEASLKAMQDEGDVDTDYGVEQQPNEGAIAHAVEDHSRHRMQAGAHAGAVGTAQGPGMPAFGEGEDTMAHLDRKGEEHRRILGERVGRSPPVPDGETAERERLRERKIKEDRELHVGDAVREATGSPVVGR